MISVLRRTCRYPKQVQANPLLPVLVLYLEGWFLWGSYRSIAAAGLEVLLCKTQRLQGAVEIQG